MAAAAVANYFKVPEANHIRSSAGRIPTLRNGRNGEVKLAYGGQVATTSL